MSKEGKSKPSTHESRRIDMNDPDAQNSEQDETGTQAQDVAGDAMNADADLTEESEHGGKPDPARVVPEDTPDLVDRMKEMRRSGRIDMDAFEGEDDMDDEPGE